MPWALSDRKEVIIIYTYEMVALADENGRTYECKYGTYSKEDGFKFNEEVEIIVEDYGWREIVNVLFHDNLWKLKVEPVKKMSLQDIEKELGYKVQIVDPEPDKKKVSEKRRKEVDDTVDMFRRLFGLDLNPEDYY